MVIIPDTPVTDSVPIVAVTQQLFIPSLGDTLPSTALCEARDSSGAIVVDLTPAKIEGLPKQKKNMASGSHAIDITVIAGYSAFDTDHFRVRFRTTLAAGSDVEDFSESLEQIYTYFKDSLSMPISNYTKWPFEIVIRDFEYEGAFSPAGLFSAAYIEINTDLVENNKRGSIMVTAHEFLHFMQSLSYNLGSDDQWFDEATAVYVEGLFAADPAAYHSDVWKAYAMQPFMGLRNGVDSADASDTWFGRGAVRSRRHGYGMVAVIKYLMDKYGTHNSTTHRLRTLFDALHANSSDPLSRLSSEFSSTGLWVQNFFEKYLTGDIYNQFSPIPSDKWTISSINDTGIDYTSLYTDLSAKMYEITLSKLDSAATLTFSSEGGSKYFREMSVIAMASGGVEKIAGRVSGDSVLTFSAMSLLTDEVRKLRVVLTYAENSRTSKGAKCTLQIRYGCPPTVTIVSPVLGEGKRGTLNTPTTFTARVSGVPQGSDRTYYWSINNGDTTFVIKNDSTVSVRFTDGGAVPIHCEIRDGEAYGPVIGETDTACTVSVAKELTQMIVVGWSLQAPMLLSTDDIADSYFYQIASDNNREGLELSWSANTFSTDAHIGGGADEAYEYTVKITGKTTDDGLTIELLDWDWLKINYDVDFDSKERYVSKKETCHITVKDIPFYEAITDTPKVKYALLKDSLLISNISSLSYTVENLDSEGKSYGAETVTGLDRTSEDWSSLPCLFGLTFTKP